MLEINSWLKDNTLQENAIFSATLSTMMFYLLGI